MLAFDPELLEVLPFTLGGLVVVIVELEDMEVLELDVTPTEAELPFPEVEFPEFELAVALVGLTVVFILPLELEADAFVVSAMGRLLIAGMFGSDSFPLLTRVAFTSLFTSLAFVLRFDIIDVELSVPFFPWPQKSPSYTMLSSMANPPLRLSTEYTKLEASIKI